MLRRCLALTAAALALTGCGTDDQPSPAKIKAAMASLRANPDTIRVQTFVARSARTGQFSRQNLLLIPVPEAPGYRIIDAQGEIFASYDDFLDGNTLPDQPGT